MSLQGIVVREDNKCVVVRDGRDVVFKNERSSQTVKGFIDAVAQAQGCSVVSDESDSSRWYVLQPANSAVGSKPPRLVIDYINGGQSYVARLELNGSVVRVPNDYSATEQILDNLGNPEGSVRAKKGSGRYRSMAEDDESGFFEL